MTARNILTRVVSVPCFELFFEQEDSYKKEIIGTSPVKIAVEAGLKQAWDVFLGTDGVFVGMKGFGASGPCEELYQYFGITSAAVVAAAEKMLASCV